MSPSHARPRHVPAVPAYPAPGDLDLKLIACSCQPSTEGTSAVNFDRARGVLTVEGGRRWRHPDGREPSASVCLGALFVAEAEAVVSV
jgi:hypothetical protein